MINGGTCLMRKNCTRHIRFTFETLEPVRIFIQNHQSRSVMQRGILILMQGSLVRIPTPQFYSRENLRVARWLQKNFFNSLIAYEGSVVRVMGQSWGMLQNIKAHELMAGHSDIFCYICVLIYNPPQKETIRFPSNHFQGALNVSFRVVYIPSSWFGTFWGN